MKLYECEGCGEPYYKKTKDCPYCDSKEFNEVEGTEREVILTILREIDLESEEYQQFDEGTLEEKVKEKLKIDFSYIKFISALGEAEKKGYFRKMTIYVSSA